jgi:phage terminase large subunit
MRDFISLMESTGYFKPQRWKHSDEYSYTFETGTKIEFFSADQPQKVRGPRRQVLFINEANNIPYETYTQLEVRTEKIILLDWNPVSEFWWYTDVVPHTDVDFLTLTYKDNEGLPQTIVDAIESRKYNKSWWQVYGLGQLGEVEGRIYTDWRIIDEIPHEARLERYGLDFGYSVDVTAITAVYKYNGGYIFDEICYRKGMSNKDIADILLNSKHALIIADSSEPKSISELNTYGLQVVAARKGPDSVRYGIQLVQEQRCSLTKRSVNGIKEYRNYLWQTDVSGKFVQTPYPGNDHFLDSVRYAVRNIIPEKDLPPKQFSGQAILNELLNQGDYA